MKLCELSAASFLRLLLGLMSTARLNDMPAWAAARLGLLTPAIGLAATVRLERRLRSFGREGVETSCVSMWMRGGACACTAEKASCEPEGVTGIGKDVGCGDAERG